MDKLHDSVLWFCGKIATWANNSCRVSNDRRPGRLVDHESVVDFEILVGRLLNDGQQGGPAGFGTGNGTLTEKNDDLLS